MAHAAPPRTGISALAPGGVMDRRFFLSAVPGLLAGACRPARAATLVVTLRAPDTLADQRNAYVRDAVALALDKTLSSHGPYQLQESPPMNKRRALLDAGQQAYPNFLLMAAPAAGRGAGLAPVLFPLHMGINGYRVCFVHAAQQQAVRRADSVAALAAFHHVQGKGWADADLLRANGFHVTEIGTYEAMFQMVALGRADLFCRSVMEIGPEIAAHAHLRGLALDDSFVLSYPLPQYLYTHPGNRELIERLTLGLHRAHADGSLPALLRRYLLPSLQDVKLAGRRVFMLASPDSLVEMDDRPFQLDLMRLKP
jgi:hypothetical protein